MDDVIYIKGARVNNLKSVDCAIPHNKLTVVSGVSGSGKSSLVFDTLYAEGQRRYVESLSSYARQFMEKMEKPDADAIEGISPAIAVQQRNKAKGRRSTVGTATEINDYLRLLYSRVGTTYCSVCQSVVKEMEAEDVLKIILQDYGGEKIFIAFPLKTGGGKIGKDFLNQLRSEGYIRFFNGNEIADIRENDDLLVENEIFVIVDRLKVSEKVRSRIRESLETCFGEGNGRTVVIRVDGDKSEFSNTFSCDKCGISYSKPAPQRFSFNNPLGACSACNGFGNTLVLDYRKIIPNHSLSLKQGAVEPLSMPARKAAQRRMLDFAVNNNIPIDVPVGKLNRAQLEMIKNGGKGFSGIEGFFRNLEAKKYRIHVRVFISRYRRHVTCTACSGTRLKPETENVKIKGKSISQISEMNILKAGKYFRKLRLDGSGGKICERILKEINRRLSYLEKVGLGYLTLSRLSSTLSGGEAQRISLASILGSSMVGTTVILDEPTIGLHPVDNRRLLKIIQSLRDIGNTMVVVEHDMEVIKAADYVVELGPGAGEKGGEIVFQGTGKKLGRAKKSLTASYLRGELNVPVRTGNISEFFRNIKIRGARENNLKNIDVNIPLGGIVCVAGVSGSGKSTLVHNVLYSAFRDCSGKKVDYVGKHKSIEGMELVDDMVMVDQSPIGRSSRSNPATYLKVFDGIRKAFAATRTAKARRLKASSFSFNTKGGRCEDCEGIGTVEVDMQFLPSIRLVCDSCDGMRYQREVLDVKYGGYNIFEVLSLTVDEASKLFAAEAPVVRKLAPFIDVGLGYIKLGQPATTLSGGEAQRMKLASFLSQNDEKERLFIFDEPTTGLHLHDIDNLLSCLRRLVKKGHSVIVIEHNLEILKNADYLIELGPEGGEKGGYVVAEGTPMEVAKQETPTSRYLRPFFCF